MFVPNVLVPRDDDSNGTPPSCALSDFTLRSNVCVGDLVVIIACGIAGVGFFLWAIHAIRKMRKSDFPFDDAEEKEESRENDRGQLTSLQPPEDGRKLSHEERVRARLFLSQPEEVFHMNAPIRTDALHVQDPVIAPRMPPRASGRSTRSSSRSNRHGSFIRGGPYGERHEYGYSMDNGYVGSIGPSRATDFPAQINGYGHMRNISTPRAEGLPADTSTGDYRRQTRRMNNDPVTYCAD